MSFIWAHMNDWTAGVLCSLPVLCSDYHLHHSLFSVGVSDPYLNYYHISLQGMIAGHVYCFVEDVSTDNWPSTPEDSNLHQGSIFWWQCCCGTGTQCWGWCGCKVWRYGSRSPGPQWPEAATHVRGGSLFICSSCEIVQGSCVFIQARWELLCITKD